MAIIGHRIEELRKQQGYTMEQLGNLCGVQKSAVNKWEKGAVSRIDSDTMDKLCMALKCDSAYLKGITSEKHTSSVIEYLTKNSDFSNELIEIVKLCRTMPESQINDVLKYARFIKEQH